VDNESLEQYVRDAYASGHTAQQIQDKLLQSGYTPDEADAAIARMQPPAEAGTQKIIAHEHAAQVSRSHKNVVLLVVLLLVLVGIAGGVLYAMKMISSSEQSVAPSTTPSAGAQAVSPRAATQAGASPTVTTGSPVVGAPQELPHVGPIVNGTVPEAQPSSTSGGTAVAGTPPVPSSTANASDVGPLVAADCSLLADKLETCEPYVCQFTYPITGEKLLQGIDGLEDGLCVYHQDLPDNGSEDCIMDESHRIAIAQFVRETATADQSTTVEMTDTQTTTTYTVNGQQVTNPWQTAFDDGSCVISGYS
jgi:hypothetical protein